MRAGEDKEREKRRGEKGGRMIVAPVGFIQFERMGKFKSCNVPSR